MSMIYKDKINMANITQSHFNGHSSFGRDDSCSDQPQSAYQHYLANFQDNNPEAHMNEGAPIKQIGEEGGDSYYSSSQISSSNHNSNTTEEIISSSSLKKKTTDMSH